MKSLPTGELKLELIVNIRVRFILTANSNKIKRYTKIDNLNRNILPISKKITKFLR